MMKKIEDGTAPREKQGEDFTMAPMLDKSISKIDWENQTAKKKKNLVRGLNPIMGAYSFLKEKKVKFWKVKILNNFDKKVINITEEEYSKLPNGTILLADNKTGMLIKCIDGIISVDEIQPENSRKMSIFDYINGNNFESFEKFM